MALALVLIILFVAFLGICTLVGLGTMLGVGRGKSSTVVSMIGGGFALLAFFLLSMLFFKANASREPAYLESSDVVSDAIHPGIEHALPGSPPIQEVPPPHGSPTPVSEVSPPTQTPDENDSGETEATRLRSSSPTPAPHGNDGGETYRRKISTFKGAESHVGVEHSRHVATPDIGPKGMMVILFAVMLFFAIGGIGTLLVKGRGTASGVVATIAGGVALLVFFFVISMYFVRERDSNEISFHEAPDLVARAPVNIPLGHAEATELPPPDALSEEAPTTESNVDTKAEQAEGKVESSTNEVQNAPPDWVNQPPQRIDNIYRTSVTSDPMLTREECEASLSPQIKKTAEEYVNQLLGAGASQTIGLDVAEIREDVCKAEYIQKRISKTVGVGEMKILHVLMEFDESFRNHVRQRYRQAVVQQRMVMAGGGALSVLMVLGSIFGYLQIDTATKGFYSGRLKLVTTVVILAIVLLGLGLLT